MYFNSGSMNKARIVNKLHVLEFCEYYSDFSQALLY